MDNPASSMETRNPAVERKAESRDTGILRSFHAFFRLARPLNGLIAFISVFLGAILASGGGHLGFVLGESDKGGINPVINVAIVAVAASLLLSAGNALNDFCDVEADRINKPSRPIPSGQVKRHSAMVFAIILFAFGTGLGLLVNWMAFLVAGVVSTLLILYDVRLRSLLLIDNIVIGILTGLTFISGGIAVRAIGGSVIPAVFAFLFTAGREVVKDIQDVRGDVMSGLSSLPIRWGERKAMYISFVFLALVILASPWPYFLGTYSLYYLICVVFGVDLILIYCMIVMLTRLTEQRAARVASIMKFDIFFGLAAIYLGRIR